MTDKKTIILGLGNPILSDDAVGIRVARELNNRLTDIEVVEASAAGFRVVDEILGYEKLIIIDSIKTGEAEPGTLFRYTADDFKSTLHFSSPHDIGFFDALQMMENQNEETPSQIDIYAVEIEDIQTFSERCTEKVEKAIPHVVERILEEQF